MNMLTFPYPYKDKIEEIYSMKIGEEYYRYFTFGPDQMPFVLGIRDNTEKNLQFVSMNRDGNILGYLVAVINWASNAVTHIGAMNFTGKVNFTFSKDIHRFLNDLFLKYGFRKVRFAGLSQNPAVNMYAKYAMKYGGKEVGRFREEVKIGDQYCDMVTYEVFRECFIKAYKGV